MSFSAFSFKINFEEIFLLQVDSMRMKNSHPMEASRVLYLTFPPRTHPLTQINEFTNLNAQALSGKNFFKKNFCWSSQVERKCLPFPFLIISS